MKLKIMITSLILTLMVGMVTFADDESDFILIGGDEYISIQALNDLGLDSSVKDGKVDIEGKIVYDLNIDALKDGHLVYVPFKDTMEAFSYEFTYKSREEMVIKKNDYTKVYKVNFRQKPDVITFEKPGHVKKDDHFIKQDRLSDKKHVDMSYIKELDKIYVHATSLKEASIDFHVERNTFIFKSMKTDKSVEIDIKDALIGYENNRLVTRVPLLEILEALDIAYELDQDKVSFQVEGQIVVFHK